jgi:hypothetical protein
MLGKGDRLVANRADRMLGAGRSRVHGEDGNGPDVDAADRRGDVCGNTDVGAVEKVDEERWAPDPPEARLPRTRDTEEGAQNNCRERLGAPETRDRSGAGEGRLARAGVGA